MLEDSALEVDTLESAPEALEYLKQDTETNLILVGREELLREKLGSHPYGDRLKIHHASETVSMDELPRRHGSVLWPGISRKAIVRVSGIRATYRRLMSHRQQDYYSDR